MRGSAWQRCPGAQQRQACSYNPAVHRPRHPARVLRRVVKPVNLERASCVPVFSTIRVPDHSSGPDLGWRTDFYQHYLKGKLIGTGSFGCVYLGIDMRTGREVAVKVMPKLRGKLTKERTLQKLAREVDILKRLQECKNVIRLYGCYETENEVLVVTEFCEGGDIQRLSDELGTFNERAVSLIAFEILHVIRACHANGILHGDIKPANFVLRSRSKNPLRSLDGGLLSSPWLVAIDFGCSQTLATAGQRFSKRTGTPVYMAPEIFERDYSVEADMWGLGMMLYQLYARRFPYWETMGGCRGSKLDEVAAAVIEQEIPFNYAPWLGMSPEGKDFIQNCLQKDYMDRLTVEEALCHSWFRRFLPPDVQGNNIVPKVGSKEPAARVVGSKATQPVC